ncbi:MAG: IS3 family transposase [Rhodospirillaceae bacterium]|nr:IS3 family transposase [Rhodospirillaceae bacterium]
MKYAFIRDHERRFKIGRMCTVLGVSRSGYYEWRDRPLSRRARTNLDLLQTIRRLHVEAREAYGADKTWRVLRARGVSCGRHRVARLRRVHGIEAKRQRRFRVIARQHYTAIPAAPNLVAQRFGADRPDQVWMGDSTFIATRAGWLFLAVLIDLYSRKVVGWAMGAQHSQELAAAAWRMAADQRRPRPGLIHHTDQGALYRASQYRAGVESCGARLSMSAKGNPHDNAVVESFFSTLKNEMVHHRTFDTREQARAAIFDYIEAFYNRQRAHASLNYLSPAEHELANHVTDSTRPVYRG